MSLLADYLRRVAEGSEAANGASGEAASRVRDRRGAHGPSERDGTTATGADVGDRRVTPRRLALSAAVALLGAAAVRRLRRDRG